MKKTLMHFCLFAMLSSSVFAGYKTDGNKDKSGVGNWNPVSIYNDTNTDVAYVMNGSYGGGVYGIKRYEMDIYHSGRGDDYAIFQVGECSSISPGPVNTCAAFKNIETCTTAHYNADHIRSIHITSLHSCTVTCLDGTDTSCKQNGK